MEKKMLKRIIRAVACCVVAAMMLAMGSGTSRAEMVYSASELSKGQVISFGATPGARMPLYWYVIDIQGSQVMLMLAEHEITMKFNEDTSTNQWAKCTLRAWLNDGFYKEVFSPAEKSIIVKKNVNTNGTVTQDFVYLLSAEEFEPLPKEAGIPRIFYDSEGKAKWWWLRSPGLDPVWATVVDSDGSVDSYSRNVDRDNIAVRPVLWINLGS